MLRNRLKHWRHKCEMNQTEFAAFLGTTIYVYNGWEQQRRQPSLEWALRIAKKLNCHTEDIFSIDDSAE